MTLGLRDDDCLRCNRCDPPQMISFVLGQDMDDAIMDHLREFHGDGTQGPVVRGEGSVISCCAEIRQAMQIETTDENRYKPYVYFSDGRWSIGGCRSEGCCVVTGITNCPWCGHRLLP